MKRLYSYFAVVIAIVAVASCSEKELNTTTDFEVCGQTINVKIKGVSTKTGITPSNGAYTPYWNNNDQISVFFDDFTDKEKVDASLVNTKAKGEEADFSADNVTLSNGTTIKEDGTLYSFYPSSAFHAVVAADNAVRLNLKTNQFPAAVDTFDPEADILIGKPSEYLYDGEYLYADIAFARVMSVLRVNLLAGSDCPENIAVNKFTMTAPEGTALTGRSKISLSTLSDDDNPVGDWTVKSAEVSATYDGDFHPVIGGNANTVYLIVNPTSIENGDVTFTIKTDNYNISKTVTLSKALVFPQGNVANINLTISNDNCEPVLAETRIFVEGFDLMTSSTDNKSKPTASKTGVTGTGITSNLSYVFSSNCDVRNNNNGHGNSNPFLWIGAADNGLTISNIAVSQETSLMLSLQTRTTQGTSSITLKYKESSAESWETATTTVSSGTSTLNDVKYIPFSIASTVTSLDLQILGSSANLIIDDIILERFVDLRETLATPTNVSAELDSEIPNKIFVSWTAVEHADSYEVILLSEGNDDISKSSANTSIEVDGLAYDTEYTIKVRSVSNDTENFINSDFALASASVTTGSVPQSDEKWVEKTIDNISSNDVVIIVGKLSSSSQYYAITNDNGTSSAPAAYQITISNNTLTGIMPNNIRWNISGNSTDGYTIYPNGTTSTWLYCNTNTTSGNNDNIRVGTGDRKIWDYNSNYSEFLTKDDIKARYLCIYDTKPDWRGYVNYENAGILKFFVRESESSGQHDSPAELVMSNVTCSNSTENSLTFSWDPVDNAKGYKVKIGDGTFGDVQSATYVTLSNLSANTQYTISVIAIGDGVEYTDSEPVSAIGTTKSAGGSGDGGETVTKTLIIDGSVLTSTTTTATADYTFDGITVTMSDGAKVQSSTGTNKFTANAILIGKSGKYIYNKTPIPGKITKFEIYANKGASAKVSVGVLFSDSSISAYSTGNNTYTATLSTVDNVYDCSSKLTSNCKYFWYQVTNANNSQVEFRITYETTK